MHLDAHFAREVPKFGQCQITQTVHPTSQSWLHMAYNVAQCGQVSQTCDTAGPNRLSTVAIPHLGESLQIPYHGIGKSIQGDS